MRLKYTRVVPVLFAVAALGTGGGAAVAFAGSSSASEPVSSVDTDNVQQQVGDQNAPDTTTNTAETTSTADTDNIQSQVGDQSAPDTPPNAAETSGGGQNEQGGAQNEQGGGQHDGSDPAGGFEGTTNFQGDFQGQQ